MLARAVPAAGRSSTGCRRTSVATRGLGHLKGNVAAMADDLRTDLDQLLAQTGQRPPLRRLGHRQRPHEVAEVISQCMEPETNGIGGECSARGSLPFDRARAFLHPLLHRPALVVK